jgi:tetratricopeptide (TPR) repeat protein
MPVTEEKKRSADRESKAGSAAFKEKQYAPALIHFKKACVQNPQLTQLYVYRSMCNGKLRDWVEAERDAAECLRHNPNYNLAYKQLATAQDQLGKRDTALSTLADGLANCIASKHQPLLHLRTKLQNAAKNGQVVPSSP